LAAAPGGFERGMPVLPRIAVAAAAAPDMAAVLTRNFPQG